MERNGKIERFFQTYDTQRWQFGTLEEFLTFYNEERPHIGSTGTIQRHQRRLLADYIRLQTDFDDLLETEITTDE